MHNLINQVIIFLNANHFKRIQDWSVHLYVLGQTSQKDTAMQGHAGGVMELTDQGCKFVIKE